MTEVTGFQKIQKQPPTFILTSHRTNVNLTVDQEPGICTSLLYGETEPMVFFSYEGLGSFLASSDFELIMKLRTCGHLVDSSYGIYNNRRKKKWAQPYMHVQLEPSINLWSLIRRFQNSSLPKSNPVTLLDAHEDISENRTGYIAEF
jgi:hypothetical protein